MTTTVLPTESEVSLKTQTASTIVAQINSLDGTNLRLDERSVVQAAIKMGSAKLKVSSLPGAQTYVDTLEKNTKVAGATPAIEIQNIERNIGWLETESSIHLQRRKINDSKLRKIDRLQSMI